MSRIRKHQYKKGKRSNSTCKCYDGCVYCLGDRKTSKAHRAKKRMLVESELYDDEHAYDEDY